MSRFLSVVHTWLGLCPDRHAIRRRALTAHHETHSSIPPVDSTYLNHGVVLDYGAAGSIRTWFVIGLVIAVLGGITVFSFLGMQTSFRQATILFGFFLLPFAVIMYYRDWKQACVEITPDSLIIRQSLHWPVIIPQDDIEKIEIRDTVILYPLPHHRILNLFIIPVCAVAILLLEYLDLGTGAITLSRFLADLVFFPCLILFFSVQYRHYRIRSNFPRTLVITTGKKERVAIYSPNPEGIAGMLERSS
jgi:hypothetical protein